MGAVFTEMALVMQLLVTAVYWPVLHAHIVLEIEPLNDPIVYWIMVFIHSWPLFNVMANVWLTKVSFVKGHYIYLVLYGMIYMVINYIGTISYYKSKRADVVPNMARTTRNFGALVGLFPVSDMHTKSLMGNRLSQCLIRISVSPTDILIDMGGGAFSVTYAAAKGHRYQTKNYPYYRHGQKYICG